MTKAVDAMDRLLADELYHRRTLSFPEQCAVYAALRRGFRQSKICRALQASSATVSFINNCERESSRRYLSVAREYRRLGHDAFCAHYLTDEVFNRFQEFAGKPSTEEEAKPRARGADYSASKYAWRPFTLRQVDESLVTLVIDWRNTGQDPDFFADDEGGARLPAGWAWRRLADDEIQNYRIRITRHTPTGPYRFSQRRRNTSTLALDSAFEDYALDPPLMEYKRGLINLTREMDR